jgi:hypothetical protein
LSIDESTLEEIKTSSINGDIVALYIGSYLTSFSVSCLEFIPFLTSTEVNPKFRFIVFTHQIIDFPNEFFNVCTFFHYESQLIITPDEISIFNLGST